ncbi:hypothetical protein R3P38DRAFT_3173727 [Favolaschia claudopus]|uniref:Uncharacterized protein n=1 Tax=Favolaschia claudopus TaxID=2862362 RepID=A0AAW0DFZ7_9AGAR
MATTTAPAKKRGSPGDFVGKRGQFLDAWLGEYKEASKKKTTGNLWLRLFPQYWANFYWRLALTEEPEGQLIIDTSPGWVAPEEEKLSKADEASRTATKEEIQKKIKGWYNHRRAHAGLAGNVWTPFLKRLRAPTTPPPKRLSDLQFYMSHALYKDKVNKKFLDEHPNTPKDQQMKVRCDVATALLAEESQEVRDWIHAEAEKAHSEQLATYNAAVAGEVPVTEEERALARTRYPEVMTPLLSAISQFTGYNLMLLAGRFETEPVVDVKVIGLNAGKTPGPDGKFFPDHNGVDYKDVLEIYSRFGRTNLIQYTEGETAPADSDEPPPPQTAQEQSPTAPASKPSIPEPESPPRSSTPPPEGPLAPKSIVSTDFESPVRRKLAMMPENERRAYQTVLEGMSSLELSNVVAEARKEEDLKAQEAAHEEQNKSQNDAPPKDAPPKDAPPKDPFQGLQITDPLRRKTLAAAEVSGDLPYEIRQLRRLSPYELVRANNIARNEELLEALKLNNAVSSILGSKRGKAPAKGSRKRGRKSGGRKGDDSSGNVADDEGEEEGEEEDEEEQADEEDIPVAERPQRPLPVNRGLREWFTKSNDQLAEGDQFGPRWVDVRMVWASREEAKLFVSPKKGISAKHRPSQIGGWIQRARNGNPAIEDVDAFGKQIRLWWHEMNPEFRKTPGSLQMKRTSGLWKSQDGKSLDIPGLNGYLSVLIALLWWRKALKEESQEWRDTVDDVKWALEQLSEPTASNSSSAAPSTDASSAPPTDASFAPPTDASSAPGPDASSSPAPDASSAPVPGPMQPSATVATAPPSPVLHAIAAPSFVPSTTTATATGPTTTSLPAVVSGDVSMLSVPATPGDAAMRTPSPISDAEPMSDVEPSNGVAVAQRPRARPNWRNASSSTPTVIAAAPSVVMEEPPSSNPQPVMGTTELDKHAAKRAALIAEGLSAEDIDEVMADEDADEDMEGWDMMQEDP